MLRNGLEPWHVIVLLAIILLVFGGRKLPELARGSGRALRIFKAETRGLIDDDKDENADGSGTTKSTGELNAAQVNPSTAVDESAPKPPADARTD